MSAAFDSPLAEMLVALRREFHRDPELSWDEHRTGDRIAEFLEGLDIPFRRGLAGTGIVADIPGANDGPKVALRADMDALPVQEETGLPFASANANIMHACGHDGHMTMVMGAARLLAEGEPPPLPVRFVFQPAEETGNGASAMVKAGALEGVKFIFGGHLDRHYPTGTLVVTDGAVNASSDEFRILIHGAGGHAARPHETIDAVVVGSLLVMALQTIVSREVNPAHPSVVTVGRFDAGTAHNVIAARAVLEGSIRAQDPEVRSDLHRAIRRISKSVGELHGAAAECEIIEGTPVLLNSPEMAALGRRAAENVVGKANVCELLTANMGAEDFSHYLDTVPGCYIRIGAHREGEEAHPAHSSQFDVDEDALEIGARYFAEVAREAGRHLLAVK